MNLEEMTIEQLKALAYDQIVAFNQAQANINLIQTEIAKREKVQADKNGSLQ